MCTKRRHSCATSDVDHLMLRGLDVKIAEGANRRNDISRLETKDITGTNAWVTVLTRGWSGDTYIEAQSALGPLVAGNRIVVPTPSLSVMGNQIEDVLSPPDSGEGFGNIETAKRNRTVRGNLELKIVTGGEGGQAIGVEGFQDKLFDECGHAAVGEHAQSKFLLGLRPRAAGPGHVDENRSASFQDRIGSEAPADGPAGG